MASTEDSLSSSQAGALGETQAPAQRVLRGSLPVLLPLIAPPSMFQVGGEKL